MQFLQKYPLIIYNWKSYFFHSHAAKLTVFFSQTEFQLVEFQG